nr:uncharacterized protein LOC111421369 [Onthophagus taurus]
MATSNFVRYGGPNYEETLMKWFNEAESDVSDVDDSSQHDMESEHDSASEFEVSEGSDDEVARRGEKVSNETAKSYYGKNRFKWSSQPLIQRSRTQKHNIVSHLPGLRGEAKAIGNSATPLQVWTCLLTNDILSEILKYTNIKLIEMRERYGRTNKPELQDLDMVELPAFFGLLYYSSIFKSNNEDLQSLFATDGTGRDIFRCIMSLQRVLVILACLRFDNIEDRQERKKEDATAAISWVFKRFVNNCQQQYSLGELTCIDEMLIGFRGHVQFRMYMPNKPNKYGIKVQILTDARTNYFYNGYIYSGKGSDGQMLSSEEHKFSIPTQSVLQLIAPIQNTNRNVTADNWFSSLEVVDELRKRGLTYVGTMRKNKREITQEFLADRKKPSGTALYGFTKNVTLVSYVPKKGKAVVLVSSMHNNSSVDKTTGKPEIIAFYNETKGGVDTLDKKYANYSTSRRTRRWPMAVFYAVLDIASVNSFVLYQSYPNYDNISRLQFIQTLSQQLVEDHLNRRLTNQRLPRELRLNIGRIVKKPISEQPSQANSDGKRKRCGICPRKNDKKTKNSCMYCKIAMCDD